MSHTIKPEEHELREARQLVGTVLSTSEAILEKGAAYETGLSWNSRFEPIVLSPEEIYVHFNTRSDDWKQRTKQVAAQAYARAWFLERVEPELHWQEVLMLGHSLLFSEQVTDEKPELNDKEEIEQRWGKLKEEFSDPAEHVDPEMMRYGFSAAYYIAKELSNRHDLEEFTDLKRSDVVNSGDRVFGR